MVKEQDMLDWLKKEAKKELDRYYDEGNKIALGKARAFKEVIAKILDSKKG